MVVKKYEALLDAVAKDIVGEKFGRLFVKETIYDYKNHTKPKVRCLCDYGIKNEYCKTHNIPLLRLPYYLDKDEIEKEIINNLIVETAVG